MTSLGERGDNTVFLNVFLNNWVVFKFFVVLFLFSFAACCQHTVSNPGLIAASLGLAGSAMIFGLSINGCARTLKAS